MANTRFYSLQFEEAADVLQSNIESGLSEDEAKKRLLEFGVNALKRKKKAGPLSIFIEQFKDLIVLILIAAAIVSGFLGEWVDAIAIIAIVIINAILGFIQEYRAEKSLEALQKLSSPTSKVIRGGKRSIIQSSEIVPGDLVEIEAGDNIPADARLTFVSLNFSTSEASLTGESVPSIKTSLKLEEKDIPLAERANMAYMGTSVASGRGRAIIIETGMNTELGKIAGMIEEIKEDSTPLQKKLEEFGKWIIYICFALVAMVFILEIARGGEMIDIFLTAVSLAVAAIPEGLPAVVTIALALGVQRMVKRHALIRKLPSVETLGSTTVICSDKTGTLTKNEMTVQMIYADNNLFEVSGVGYEPKGDFLIDGKKINPSEYPGLKKCLMSGILCNSAELVKDESGYKIAGDPTEGAIIVCAEKLGLVKKSEEKKAAFIEEIPFDAVRKKMAVIRKEDDKYIVFSKGAPDVLIDFCGEIEENGVKKKIDANKKEEILKLIENLSKKALRVLAAAYKNIDHFPDSREIESVEKDLTFIGLIAMIDPPREEVKAAIKLCESAGIKTVMITGDHKNTAEAIARELGINKVYSRVSPEDKLRIVRELKGKGEIVAMTGDGVNDAPAVKEANIGIAMGITGTDVTKSVSDMIITDDNFASIVSAVEEGRSVYNNIKKFIHYLLSCNAGEILVMFVSSLIGLPVPLVPVQILWVNLVTDGLPALALGVDPKEPDVMKKPPRDPAEKVVTLNQTITLLMQGAFIAICSLLAFSFVYFIEQEGIARARTAAFIVLSVSQLFHSFNCRSNTESIFKLGIFSNINLVYAFIISFLLQMAVVYAPFLSKIFKTEYLSSFDWILVIIISSFPLLGMELFKLGYRIRRGKK